MNNTIYSAFLEYVKLGFDPIPIPPNDDGTRSKYPRTIVSWQTRAAAHDFTKSDFEPTNTNVSNLLGGVKHLADVDCDTQTAVRIAAILLSFYLPEFVETCQFGRTGKRRSHYLAYLDEDVPTVKLTDPMRGNKAVIELRSASKDGTRGEQTVFPPSLWQDNEEDPTDIQQIEFEPGYGLDQIKPAIAKDLLHVIHLIAAVCLMADYFPEGDRHNCKRAWARVFHDAGFSVDEAVFMITAAYAHSPHYCDNPGKNEKDIREPYELLDSGKDVHLFGRPLLEALYSEKLVAKICEYLDIPPTVKTSTSGQKKPTTTMTVDEIFRMLDEQSPELHCDEKIEYLIEDVIPKAALIMITGKPGCGKTTLVHNFCIEMATNGNDVLFLDRDNPGKIAGRRFRRLGQRPKNFKMWGNWNLDGHSKEPLQALSPDDPILRDVIKRMKNPVLVFDTFAMFSECDSENDNTQVNAVFKKFRQLQSLGCTVIVIHHSGKAEGSKSRGGSAMECAVDLAMMVTPVFHGKKLVKMKLDSFKVRETGVELVYGMRDGIPFRETVTEEDKLMNFLETHPGLSKEKFAMVAQASKFHRQTVRDFITAGEAAGTIRYEGRKLFAVSKHTFEDEDDGDDLAAAA